MSIEDENIEYTHIVYSVDCVEKITLTKIGVALVNAQGSYTFNVNPDHSKGDILLYRKSTLTENQL
ncbi:hypothetical protein [Raoultella terrigena]|uniref:hypothetical protein n=1 Tax=Raoultella terrigena TaxID=577 RepID=UPI000907FDBE|nr:hypothetical protein [Raoultella terrigena]